MPGKIVDPDDLIRGPASDSGSIHFSISNPESRWIYLADTAISASSNIDQTLSGSDSGVTGQALYSKLKELWKSETDLIRIPFPMISITKNQFDFVNNWNLGDSTTQYLIRDAGWSVRSGSANTDIEQWVGIVTLGSLGATDQVYYQQSNFTASSVDFQMPGPVNQAIQILSQSIDNVLFDYRGFTKLFVREWGKTYADASIQDDLAVVTEEYTVYSLPLTNTQDIKIQETNESSASVAPYNEVTITYLSGSGFANYADGETYVAGTVVYDAAAGSPRWYITNAGGTTVAGDGTVAGNAGTATFVAYPGERDIGGTYYAFNVIIDAGAGQNNSIEQIYTRVQYELRLNSEIDDASPKQLAYTVTGKTADSLLRFLGDTLITSNGVYIDNFQDADTNDIDFFDVGGTVRRFPFVSTGIISFNDNLSNDASAEFFMFFTSVPSGSYGSASAVVVQDNLSLPITGSIAGSSSYSFTFDYDNNAQGGRTAGTDAAVTVVAIGLATAQYVSTTGTIARSKANSISLVSALERNYDNPA